MRSKEKEWKEAFALYAEAQEIYKEISYQRNSMHPARQEREELRSKYLELLNRWQVSMRDRLFKKGSGLL